MAEPEGEILERWQGWLEKLFQQLCELHHDRAIWRELVALVDTNRDIPEPWFFLDWIRRLWASTMVVGIRRIADRDRRSVSLARLLADVACHPEVLSRKHYCDLFDQPIPATPSGRTGQTRNMTDSPAKVLLT